MDSNVTAASSTALVAIVAILTNNQRIGDLSRRMDRIESRMDRIVDKLDHVEQLLVGYAIDVARIKEKLGIS